MREDDQQPPTTLFRHIRRHLLRKLTCHHYEKPFLVCSYPNSRSDRDILDGSRRTLKSYSPNGKSISPVHPASSSDPHVSWRSTKTWSLFAHVCGGAEFEEMKFSCLLPHAVSVFRSPTLFFLHFFPLEKIPKTNHHSAMFAARSRSEPK